MKAQELAEKIGATVAGDGSVEIRSANTLEAGGPGDLSFLANPRYMRLLHRTKASAVIAPPGVGADNVVLLHTTSPYYAFTQAMVILHGYRKHPFEGVHPQAFVDKTATIGEGTTIYPGAFVGPRAKIGRDCILYPGVVVYDDCVLGDRVTVHANSVIGQDGFGYATYKGEHHKIPQTGNAVLEDDVEIGANCSIDRAAMGSTVIGKGTKFSNNVVIGHGSKIGPHGLFVAQVGVAGSTTIGHHAVVGGQVAIVGHLKIGDNVNITGRSAVLDDIPDQTTLMGHPAMPASKGRRVQVAITQLPEMLKRIKELEQQVAELATDQEKKK
jgi:UDP-3-O-[3-hydroxymyristoyl] glucosamine N-acyltransferase